MGATPGGLQVRDSAIRKSLIDLVGAAGREPATLSLEDRIWVVHKTLRRLWWLVLATKTYGCSAFALV